MFWRIFDPPLCGAFRSHGLSQGPRPVHGTVAASSPPGTGRHPGPQIHHKSWVVFRQKMGYIKLFFDRTDINVLYMYYIVLLYDNMYCIALLPHALPILVHTSSLQGFPAFFSDIINGHGQ